MVILDFSMVHFVFQNLKNIEFCIESVTLYTSDTVFQYLTIF